MMERQQQRKLQQLQRHPNRTAKGVVDLPDMPPPPIFAEEAGPEKGLPLALEGLVNRPFLATERYRQQQTRAVRTGVHPKVLKFEAAFVRRMKRLGIPMFAHCVTRTLEEQSEMVRAGVSRDSPADGVWPHQWAAVDLIHSVKGWQMNDEEWRLIGHLGKEVSAQLGVSMTWGGDWDFYDPAHWELKNWQEEPAKWWKAYPEWIRENPGK